MKKAITFLSIILGLLTMGVSTNSHAVANASFEGTHFTGSGRCAECHDNLTDIQGKDISIAKNWSSSMMANSTRDPYWRAKVASELHRNPNLSDEINDKCSRCHAPMANDAAKKEGAPLEILGSGFLNAANTYYDHALDGVSCTVCHQIADDGNLGTLAGVSGNYSILQFANAVDRPAFGQYLDPRTMPMQNRVQFTPQKGTHTSTSEMCATCHDLKTPFVDAAGNAASTTPESEFPEQMVYSEWNNSAYKTGGAKEQTCQGCHMPKVAGSVKIASRPQNLNARPDFAEHTFLGANTTMMDILNNNRTALEVTSTGFKQSIADTQTFLKSAASIDILSTEIIADQLKVVVKVTNKTGHKLPSAYPSRRAYIHFLVQDSDAQTVFESGKLNADGSIVGVAGDTDSSTYEPHYEQITTADQVQVYEPIMQNTDGDVTHTLLRAAAYKKDNRLTPAGFDKTVVPNDVAVVGLARSDADFNSGSDTLTYLINVGSKRSFIINASLEYQTLSFGHLQDMFKDAVTLTEVATFKSMFNSATLRAETLTTITKVSNDITTSTPVATNSTLKVAEGVATSGQLSASDADNNILLFNLVSNGTKGTAVLTNATTGVFTYTPTSGQTGEDTLTFNVNDGTNTSNTATVTITIKAAASSGSGGSFPWYGIFALLLLGWLRNIRKYT